MEQLKYWLHDLLDGIEAGQNKEICIALLKKCGANCAKRNALPNMTQMKAELAGISDMDTIAGIVSRHTGAECTAVPGGFIAAYNRGRGCDCAIVRDGYADSPAFCNCTLGFHETLWSAVFERPVQVELTETFLRGGDCCAQRITFIATDGHHSYNV